MSESDNHVKAAQAILLAEGENEANRLRLVTLHKGLLAEEMGWRLTSKAPKASAIIRREHKFKGTNVRVREQFEEYMRSLGGFEDYLSRNDVNARPPRSK